MTISTTCTRCGRNPRAPKQRWCGPCRLEYKRAARVPRGTGQGTGTGNSLTPHDAAARMTEGTVGQGVVRVGQSTAEKARPSPPPPAAYVPFAGTHDPREPWYPAFLADLAVNGGISLAAAAAGVHRNRVYRRMDDDPAFAEEVEVAKAYYRDHLEWESVNLARRRDNPLPYFARLKAELPARYIDRQAVLLAAGPQREPSDAKALLAAMLGSALEPTREALTGPDPLALVEPGASQDREAMPHAPGT
jgi:hypothetical protein